MSVSFCVSTSEWDEFSVSKDDSVTSGFDSKWLLLFFITFEGTITIISEDSIQHIEPTLMYGNMKPPIVYNQAPKAGPKISFLKCKSIHCWSLKWNYSKCVKLLDSMTYLQRIQIHCMSQLKLSYFVAIMKFMLVITIYLRSFLNNTDTLFLSVLSIYLFRINLH